ncbi:MAG: DUF503 domain-containing protein [Planctomycetota bacterium]
MIVGILQAEIKVDHAECLKDKRRVVRSLKDRLHREHQVSVAEVGAEETINLAVLGVTMAGKDGQRVRSVMDRIVDKLRHGRDYYLDAYDVQMIEGR